MATLLAGASLHSDRWNESVCRDLLANLRTTWKLGFRGDRMDMPDLERNGWRYYHDASPVTSSSRIQTYAVI